MNTAILENEIRLNGVSFQLLGDINANGNIRLKKMTSCAVDLFLFRRFPDEFSGVEFIAKVRKCYNAKLEKTSYWMQRQR